MKLLCWNVNGLRSVHQKGLLSLLKMEKPDLFCAQETKLGTEQESKAPPLGDDYVPLFSSAERKGYSGVLTCTAKGFPYIADRIQTGIGKRRFDSEGRFLISHHRQFVLYNVYIPSGTMGDERQNFKYKFLDSFLSHLKSLSAAQRKKLIICGDFNICHREIDIHHPDVAEKRGLSGFLPDERKWMDSFAEIGFVDTFRLKHGDSPGQYTWWSFRAGARKKNLGWRIDYIFVSRALAKRVRRADIMKDVSGSDHCPILLEMD